MTAHNHEPSNMTNIVERLREMADPKRVGSHFHPLYGEAADEIERHYQLIREIINGYEHWRLSPMTNGHARLGDAIAIARAALAPEQDK